MKNISNQNIIFKDKKVLLRVDLNVPIENGSITEYSRIEKILPTIKTLAEKEAKIIILSHIGRPKGKIVEKLSLKPVCEDLKIKLKQNIKFITKNIKEILPASLFSDQNEKIIMLENLRFYQEEEENNSKFAKHLASLADIYVNDAFSCSHRAHTSIFEITKLLPSYAGLQLNLEINALTKITNEIKIPTIGIGSSSYCDGQILVTDDIIGLTNSKIRFVKKYVDLKKIVGKATKRFKSEVINSKYPTNKYSY